MSSDHLHIHGDPTAEQLALKPDDCVEVLRGNGLTEFRRVKYAPWQLGGGEWVVGIRGIVGGYALCRVKPAPERSDEHAE